MKKIILPTLLVFVCFLILGSLFPINILADNKDCPATWNSERYACAGAYRKCYEQCGAAPGIAPDSCYKSCDNTSEACKKEADANFEACKNASKNKTPAPSEVKEVQPTAMPTTAEESEPEDCWGKYMAADGCTPQYSACTRECPKDASTAQRACEEACSKESQACRDESSANYRACAAANTKMREEGTKSELQDELQISQEQPRSDFFGIDPMVTWRNIWELANGFLSLMDIDNIAKFFYGDPIIVDPLDNPPGSFDSEGKPWNFLPGFIPSGDGKSKAKAEKKNATTEENREAMFKFSDLPKRTPEMTEEIIKQYRQEREKMMGSGQKEAFPYSIDILRGQAQIKYPNESQWRGVKVGEKIPPGSTIFTGMDTTTILTIEGVGVVEIAPFTEVKIDQSGIEQAVAKKEIFTDINLRKGEIEVNVEKGVFTAPILDVHTPNATTSIRGTHFWVSYKDNQTVVGVYEGKVEVKTNDGRIQEITPNGDKPGMVVISQKLSVPKLAIAGTVVVLLIIGVIWFLKRKSLLKVNSTGRKKR